MREFENILLDTSRHYYVSATEFAKSHIYYATSVGFFQCNSNYKVNRLNYENFLFIMMTSGTLWYRSSTGSGIVKTGQALLLDCNYPHSYGAMQECSFLFCHFGGAQSKEICTMLLEKGENVLAIDDFTHIADWIGSMMTTLEENKLINEYDCSACIYETLMIFMKASLGKEKEGTIGDESMDRAFSYIRQHLNERITVKQLAKAAGYSVDYFSHQFTQKMGKSPYKFILKCRLEQAMKLLQTTNLSIQEIAEKTGFSTASNFSSVFRAETQMTPREYRKLPF